MPATQASMIEPDEHADLNGDFERVVRLYRASIYRFALVALGSADAAETVTQDCFLKAYQARREFRNECALGTWLMRIVVNLVRDHARNRRWQFWKRMAAAAPEIDVAARYLGDGQPSPESRVLLRERVNAVWKVARSLPEGQRTVFLLRFVEDLDLLEIAKVTGMKEGTVKTHLFRAVHAVRDRLGMES